MRARMFRQFGCQLAASLAVGLFSATAPAEPPPNIQARLKEMACRVQTAHYLLLADIKAVRLDRYGEALEKMYSEYEAGFGQLLKEKTFNQERFTVVVFAVNPGTCGALEKPLLIG